MLKLTAFALILSLSFAGLASAEKAAKKGESPVLKNTVKDINGKDVDLSKYAGKVLLIVNVASKCGATPQYKDLQALHEKYKDKGLVVLGFPCNQFGKQEPGSEDDIKEFCSSKYSVTFDMFSKVDVNGENASPLYKYLTSKETPVKDQGDVKWNFEKFIVARDGNVSARFRTKTNPSSKEVVEVIESELAKSTK